jgi:peptide/nickel transport system substrate-binding protein
MMKNVKGLSIFTGMLSALLLVLSVQNVGAAAPTSDMPVSAKEWAAKQGYDWGPKYYPGTPARGGIYQSAVPQYVGLMNPNHWPVNDWVAIGYFYDKLIYTDGKYRSTVPWLAESWKFLDDVTVVMKLRQGIQFHDGSTFNAEGLKYQMEWIMDAQNGAWTRQLLEPVKSIEVIDTYTLKWHFKRPWAGFLGVMSNVPGYVMSAKALKADVALRDLKKLSRQMEREKKKVEQAEKEGNAGKTETARKKLAALEEQYKKTAALAEGAKELDNNPVGTGQYIFEEGSPGNYLKVKRNPNWWFAKFIGKDMPYYDGIKLNIIPDPSVRLANLRAGKLDYMVIDPSQYPMVKNDRNLQVFIYPRNQLVSMAFNHKDGPCKDIRVRKAISHAIDRKALINGVAFGLGRPAACMLPEDHWAHNPNLKPVSYDPALSKKLLAEAGYKNGLTIKGSMSNISVSQTLAEAIKAMLAKVGINWKVELVDPAAGAESMRNVDYDFGGGGWDWIYDPDLIATGLYHPDGGFNYGRSHNEKAIALIEAGRKEVNEEKRLKIYQELEKVLYDNYEDCWLWHPMFVGVYRKNVQGLNNAMYIKLRDGYSWSHPAWFKGGRR